MRMRRRCRVVGTVQGVGFRPFAARLAQAEQILGFVRNGVGQVVIEVEGDAPALDRFAQRLTAELPTAARIRDIEWCEIPVISDSRGGFRIVESDPHDTAALVLPPDLAMCSPCAKEVHTPQDRRENYGFGSCTACGPRFSVARATPWDRARTSMDEFAMCTACAGEYRDIADSRYHAQTIACPQCGPQVRLCDRRGQQVDYGYSAVRTSAKALAEGAIVAFKSIGGFLLLAQANDPHPVARLRAWKHRPQKPLALIVSDLKMARAVAVVGAAEQRALSDPAAPIVICETRPGASIVDDVTGGFPHIGIMLPSSPLHLLIATEVGAPLVATSGNVHGAPVCIDDTEAMHRLAEIADVFLLHNRDIERRCDDSVVDIVGGEMRSLRMGRGLAPRAVPLLHTHGHRPILATGAHLKVAPVLAVDGQAVLWPHIGDMSTAEARTALTEAMAEIETFVGACGDAIACDEHPDYGTTLWAERDGRPMVTVQHHHAHVAACLAEWGEERALGFVWDGAGLGTDGDGGTQLWGGEVLDVRPNAAQRVAHMMPFPLIGGDAAARDGMRALSGMCTVAGIDLAECANYARVAHVAPMTTSVGRMFDAVAALTAVCRTSTFEGEAAMRLEALVRPGAEPYSLDFSGGTIDWRPMLRAMVAEREFPDRVASRFHATLVQIIARISEQRRAPVVALTGGCFQNRRLVESAMDALTARGIRAITPISVPPNDGGLALGQAWVAIGRMNATM